MRHFGVIYRTGDSTIDDLIARIHNNTLREPSDLGMDGGLYDGWLVNMIGFVERLPEGHPVRSACHALYTFGRHWSYSSVWTEAQCGEHYRKLVERLWPVLDELALSPQK